MPPRQGDSDGSSRQLELSEFLWLAADDFRGVMDVSRYKELVLGLIFLKHLNVEFEGRREELVRQGTEDTDPGRFWLPPVSRWPSFIDPSAERRLSLRLKDAADAVRYLHPSLADVLRADFDPQGIHEQRLAELVSLIDGIVARPSLPMVFEAALAGFADLEGTSGSEFSTPPWVVELVTELLEPLGGRVYDPACGTGGMLLQASEYAASHRGAGPGTHLDLFGQDVNGQFWNIATMNLAIHGVEGDLGARPADTLTADQHPDLKADFIMTHPPFNLRVGDLDPGDGRWQFGVPPVRNANYAWLQHVVSKLGEHGTAGVLLTDSSVDTRAGGQDRIRRALIEADLVAAIVALPANLFPSTSIPTCLWVLAKDKTPYEATGRSNRRNQILFMDARDMAVPIDRSLRSLRTLRGADIATIAGTYQSWRGTPSARRRGDVYRDQPGFCFSAELAAVRAHKYTLAPAPYVGSGAATAAPVRNGPAASAARTAGLTKDLYGLFD
ncbi:N-6 DNA methylase [Kitasatospora sp. NPDC051170]|uniref:type I restriction-modification system subunit M n=1 Tax=Kitasatospora sp. NPDC051170 TaxID=3364056 RepID=UPI0037A94D61